MDAITCIHPQQFSVFLCLVMFETFLSAVLSLMLLCMCLGFVNCELLMYSILNCGWRTDLYTASSIPKIRFYSCYSQRLEYSKLFNYFSLNRLFVTVSVSFHMQRLLRYFSFIQNYTHNQNYGGIYKSSPALTMYAYWQYTGMNAVGVPYILITSLRILCENNTVRIRRNSVCFLNYMLNTAWCRW